MLKERWASRTQKGRKGDGVRKNGDGTVTVMGQKCYLHYKKTNVMGTLFLIM
jgi:hypothetical protein